MKSIIVTFTPPYIPYTYNQYENAEWTSYLEIIDEQTPCTVQL